MHQILSGVNSTTEKTRLCKWIWIPLTAMIWSTYHSWQYLPRYLKFHAKLLRLKSNTNCCLYIYQEQNNNTISTCMCTAYEQIVIGTIILCPSCFSTSYGNIIFDAHPRSQGDHTALTKRNTSWGPWEFYTVVKLKKGSISFQSPCYSVVYQTG